jgi:hypothetical protein
VIQGANRQISERRPLPPRARRRYHRVPALQRYYHASAYRYDVPTRDRADQECGHLHQEDVGRLADSSLFDDARIGNAVHAPNRRRPVTAREALLATTGSAMDGLGWPMTKRRMRVRTIGPLQHLTLERETDIMRVIALRISPQEMQRCRVQHTICLVYLPLGLNRMRIG